MTSRRDELVQRLAGRGAGRGQSGGRLRGRVAAVVLGWLVLMTVWGFGRAWHGGLAPVELALGLLAGTITAVLAWRRAARRHVDRTR